MPACAQPDSTSSSVRDDEHLDISDAVLSAKFVIDMDGRIAEFNQPAERLFGYRRDSVIGRPAAGTLTPMALRLQYGIDSPENLVTFLSGITDRWIKGSALRADGSEIRVETIVLRTVVNDAPRFIVYVREISADNETEVAYARLLLREAAARAAAEQARDRIARLHAITAALAEVHTSDQAAAIILEQGAAVLGARFGSLALLMPGSDQLRVERQVGYGLDFVMPSETFSISSLVPLAEAARTGEPVWISSVDEWRQRYPHLIPIVARMGDHASAAIPLLVEGRTLGALELTFSEPRMFDAEERNIALALARQCAVALERARLYEAERAARLSVEYSQQQIITAEENVRREIAEMLHGPVQTRLLVAWQRLRDCRQSLERNPAVAGAVLDEVCAEIDQVREHDIRRASHALHPTIITIGLLPALLSLVRRFRDTMTVDLDADPFLSDLESPFNQSLSIPFRLAVYRVCEEALGNVLRHAQAQAAHIRVRLTPDSQLELTVSDDGRGFDADRLVPGMGLSSIAGRVGQFGGRWHLSGERGQGAVLTATFPVSQVPSPVPPPTPLRSDNERKAPATGARGGSGDRTRLTRKPPVPASRASCL